MSPRILFFILALALTDSAAAQVTVAQDGRGDFNGADEKPILAAIASVKAQGGGEIVIHPGVYVVNQSILMKGVVNVTLRGLPGATLKLAPLQHAEVSSDVAVGETVLPVRVQRGITVETLVQIRAPGAIDTFSGKAKPTFYSKLAKVEEGRLTLALPLAHPVPAKTQLVNENAPNLLELREGCENIVIEGLTIDGGRMPEDPAIAMHAQACGIFASGKYNYTDGPTGKPVRGLTIRDCTIRNCFGRAVAFYSVIDSLVAHCRIEDIVDEAVDLDHFAVNCRVLDNQIVRSRIGVEMNDANECWVARNRIESVETGVNLWRWCKMEDLNVRNQILDNLFLNIAGNALQFGAGTKGNIARGNIIRGTGRNGISMGASDTVIAGNIIERTGMHGITVAGEGNEITGNRVADPGIGAAQKFAGIRIGGAKNRVFDNLITSGEGAEKATQPAVNGGADNLVR
jgi:hypothetical protein